MDDFEKWWATKTYIGLDIPRNVIARAAYEAGRTSRNGEIRVLQMQRAEIIGRSNTHVLVTTPVIEAAERVEIFTQLDGQVLDGFRSRELMVALRTALAEYHAVTNDDQKPSRKEVGMSKSPEPTLRGWWRSV